MTRKGTAVAGAAALALASLTAAPAAYAAETLALAPSAGAEYTALTTSSFQLDAGFAGSESAEAAATLKFRVKNAGEAALDVSIAEGGDASVWGYKYGTVAGAELDVDPTSDPATDDDDTSDDDFVAYSQNGTPVIGAAQSITIEPTAGFTDNITLVVQAWLDLDGDNTMDANEATSPARTVTYYAAKNVTGTATLEAPVLGVGTLTANVTFAPALNVQQIDATDVRVRFLENNATAALAGDTGAATDDADAGWFAATYDAVEEVVDADLATLSAVAVNTTVYGAQVYFFDGAGTAIADYAKSGAAAFTTVSAGVVTALASAAVRADDSVTSSLVREGSGSFKVYADVTTVAAGYSVAGQTVTFTITDSALTAGASVTAGGKTLTVAGTSITATAVSDANGEAEIEIAYAGFDATDGDAITIEASAVGAAAIIQGGANAAVDLTLTAHGSTGDFVVDNIAGNKQLESVIGATSTVSYTIVDEFGQTPEGVFQLVMSEDGTGAIAATVAISGGKASFSWVENSPAANDYVLTATLQKKSLAGVFENVAGPITETTNISAVAAAQVAGAITNQAYDADGADDGLAAAHAMTLSAQSSGDEQIAQTTVAVPTTATEYVQGTVTAANGTPLKGVPVTVTSTGLVMLTSDDGNVNGIGSITVRTGTDGVYKVFVTSNSHGKQTVTATSGAVSKAEVIYFAEAASSTATQISFAGSSATAKSGQTFKIVATLSDKYGNPVDIDAGDAENMISVYTGPGLLIPGTLPVVTDANGQLTWSVLLGSNDTGDATIVVGYDKNSDGDLLDALTGDLSATWTVDVNPVAAPAADTKVNAGSFKGYVAIYAKGHMGKRLSAKVGKDWVVVPALASNFVRVVEYTGAGYTIAVRIYIDRVLVDTITVTTK